VTLLSASWWANPAHHGFNPDEPGQKSTRIEICKKISTQPGLNPWWAGLARGFQPILTALLLSHNNSHASCAIAQNPASELDIVIGKGKRRVSWKYTIGRKIKTVNWLTVSCYQYEMKTFWKSIYCHVRKS